MVCTLYMQRGTNGTDGRKGQIYLPTLGVRDQECCCLDIREEDLLLSGGEGGVEHGVIVRASHRQHGV